MCRLAAWIGPPRPLSSLTHDPPHGLVRQSWAPERMLEATLNADGAGLTWYPDDDSRTPARYRTAGPIWSDENLASVAPRVRAGCIVAAIRSATPGLPVGPASTPPYVSDVLSFAHNGYLERFRELFMRPLRERLSDEAYATIAGGTDSEHLFALVLELLSGARSTEALAEAVAGATRFSAGLARGRGVKAAMNVVLSNGDAVLATRFAEPGPAPSLFFAKNLRGYEEGVVIASEPLTEDSAWTQVPERTLLVAREGGRVERLEL